MPNIDYSTDSTIKTVHRSRFIAAAITMLFGPLAGNMYAGFVVRGAMFQLVLAVFMVLFGLQVNFIPALTPVFIVAIFVFWVYLIVDSGKIAKKGSNKSYNRWYFCLLACLALFIFSRAWDFMITKCIVTSYYMTSSSMEPTIIEGDHVFVGNLVFRFVPPRRGDIVVFVPPPTVNSDKVFMQRIVAVGGDVVEVKDSHLLLNHKLAYEEFFDASYRNSYSMESVIVPHNSVFVMGDYRNNSIDSHVWGPLPKRNIRGKVLYRYWPIERIGHNFRRLW